MAEKKRERGSGRGSTVLLKPRPKSGVRNTK